MQYKLSQLPILKIVFPILLGIVVFNSFFIQFSILYAVTVLLFILLLSFHFSIHTKKTKRLTSIVLYIFLICLGGSLYLHQQREEQKNHFSLYTANYAKGIIELTLSKTAKSYKTILSIEEVIDSNSNIKKCSGKLLAYFEKDSSLSNLQIGDEVLFKWNATEIQSSKNIAEFDYKNYLENKSIYQQQYIPVHSIHLIQKHKKHTLKRISASISLFIQSILRKYIEKPENMAVANGILLGNDDDINRDTYNTFAFTGILHILSVSGLHVGIVYMLLAFLLSFIKDKNLKIKYCKFIFILVFIWMFTFVTGSSTACVRAALLFTLIHTGKIQREYVNSVNLLAGAALLQIFFNANVVFDVGFQLSYLAMFGLLFLYKPIYAIYYSSNFWIDKIWQLWSASIAAQIFTVPLSIYYFGNFPTYFLIANLFAIPLSFSILWCCLLLIPLSLISFLAVYFGKIISFQIDCFLFLSQWLANLPMGKWNNIYLSYGQLLILMLAMSLILAFYLSKKPKYLLVSLSLILICILQSYYFTIFQHQKKQIVLYSIPKNMAIAYQHQGKQILISKDKILDKDYSFSIANSHRLFQIDNYTNKQLDSTSQSDYYYEEDVLVLKNKSFYFLTQKNTRKSFKIPLEIDYLMVSDNCYLNIDAIRRNFKYQKLFISSDNDAYHVKIYRKLFAENKIDFWDLNEKYYQTEI